MKRLLPFFILLTAACTNDNRKEGSTNHSTIDSAKAIAYAVPEKSKFLETINGKQTDLFVLNNTNNMQVAITNYGGRIVSILVPGNDGKPIDVVVGSGSIDDFQNSTEPYFGALIGRNGNRIAKAKFSIDGKEYALAANNGPNNLHSGPSGFHYQVFDANQVNDHTLELSYLSKDGEGGFPGNLKVKVVYTLTDNNELRIDYEATTDKKTVCNLTNHAFFNLNGEGSGTINNHILMIKAGNFTPVDSTLIPLGKNESVKGTPFDFTTPTAIGLRVDADDIQLKHGKGYDHNFVLDKGVTDTTVFIAAIEGDKSGIVMEIFTQEPGLQFYGGNFMQGKNKLKSGAMDDFRTSFALETQHYPDAPNQKKFPSTILEPGRVYKTSSVYKFSIAKN